MALIILSFYCVTTVPLARIASHLGGCLLLKVTKSRGLVAHLNIFFFLNCALEHFTNKKKGGKKKTTLALSSFLIRVRFVFSGFFPPSYFFSLLRKYGTLKPMFFCLFFFYYFPPALIFLKKRKNKGG